MINPHPPLSAFPIVLFTTLLFGEAAYTVIRKDFTALRLYLLSLTLVSLIATYFSGYWGVEVAKELTPHVAPEVIGGHQSAAKAFLFFSPAFFLFGFLMCGEYRSRRIVRSLYFLSLFAMWCAAARVSYLGGELVFRHGAAVLHQLSDTEKASSIAH